MTAETMGGVIGLAGKIIYRGELFNAEMGWIDTTRTANGTDLKPGMLVTTTGETPPDVDVAADGEAVYGILLEDPSEKYSATIDTVYTDDKPVRILRFPAMAEVWVLQVQAVAAATLEGDIATTSADTDGTITNVVADFAIDYCGKYATYDAAGSTDPQVERIIFM
jgi:hypothetical protein